MTQNQICTKCNAGQKEQVLYCRSQFSTLFLLLSARQIYDFLFCLYCKYLSEEIRAGSIQFSEYYGPWTTFQSQSTLMSRDLSEGQWHQVLTFESNSGIDIYFKFSLLKGQIISECPYEIIVCPKIATEKFPRFLSQPLRRGQIKKIKALYYANQGSFNIIGLIKFLI